MDLKDIQAFIKFVTKSGASEVNVKTDKYEIQVRTDSDEPKTVYQTLSSAPVAAAPQAVAPAPASTPEAADAKADAPKADESKAAADTNLVEIKSPMIGTFYRRPSPEKDLFVNVGDKIQVGTTVCMIEAMKLFNEIESEVSGTIVKILVEDSSPVEYDQPLFLVEPA